MKTWLQNTWDLSLDAAPWLLLGLIAAGLIKAFLPNKLLDRWLGNRNGWSILRAAMIGAPLPLCSCGVLPAAFGLRRQGASRGATVSFLVATPETGVDSVAVSYALLGPFFAIVRPIAAILSAVAAGLTSQLVADRFDPDWSPPAQRAGPTGCRDTEATPASNGLKPSIVHRLIQGLRYALTDLIDDLSAWIAIGIAAAAAVSTFVPVTTATTWGSGLGAMIAMTLIGVPIYICATASTPLAAAMLQAGVSPGTVLVFLLAGPATNIATIGLVRRELGTAVLFAYLGTVCFGSIGLGLLTDLLVSYLQIDIHAQVNHGHELLPEWFSVVCLSVLIVFSIRPLRRSLLRR